MSKGPGRVCTASVKRSSRGAGICNYTPPGAQIDAGFNAQPPRLCNLMSECRYAY
jgi:hypothetical protein